MLLTESEKSLVRILKSKRGRGITATEILKMHYDDGDVPKYARNSVIVMLNNLIKKTKSSRADFKIKKTRRKGPHPIEFWIER